MVALSTHDTKRSEDVRARIGVLSQVPSVWAELVGKWVLEAPPPDLATGLFLLQNIFGVWPIDGVTDELRPRLHAYAEKAIREAALLTSWNDPDATFEAAVHAWLDTVMDGPVATDLTSLVIRLDEHAQNDALGQKLLALTVPGVPDVYQGTELWDDSLVDPDNRRPVDYRARREALRANSNPKMRVVTAALRLRRDRPDTFTDGGYTPVLAEGAAAEHVVAFLRADNVLSAVTRHSVELAETRWRDNLVETARRRVGRPHRRRPVQRQRVGVGLVRRPAGRTAGAARWLNSRCGHRCRTGCASTWTARFTRWIGLTTAGGTPTSTRESMRATASSSTTTQRCCRIPAPPASPKVCTSARSCGSRSWTPGPMATGTVDRSRGGVIYELHVGNLHAGRHVRLGGREAGLSGRFGRRFCRADAGQRVRRDTRLGL